MKTRSGDRKHGDLARGWETLPRDERPGSGGRMFQLIREHDGLRQRTLEITFPQSDADAHSLTFC